MWNFYHPNPKENPIHISKLNSPLPTRTTTNITHLNNQRHHQILTFGHHFELFLLFPIINIHSLLLSHVFTVPQHEAFLELEGFVYVSFLWPIRMRKRLETRFWLVGWAWARNLWIWRVFIWFRQLLCPFWNYLCSFYFLMLEKCITFSYIWIFSL